MKIKRVEHVAIAVQSLAQSIDLLKNTFGLALEYEEQIGQTRLAMLPVGETYIELLEGQGPESGVSKWMTDHGPGLFHICFEVEDIDGALAEAEGQGRQAARRDSAHRPWRCAHRLHRCVRHRQRPDRAGRCCRQATARPREPTELTGRAGCAASASRRGLPENAADDGSTLRYRTDVVTNRSIFYGWWVVAAFSRHRRSSSTGVRHAVGTVPQADRRRSGPRSRELLRGDRAEPVPLRRVHAAGGHGARPLQRARRHLGRHRAPGRRRSS